MRRDPRVLTTRGASSATALGRPASRLQRPVPRDQPAFGRNRYQSPSGPRLRVRSTTGRRPAPPSGWTTTRPAPTDGPRSSDHKGTIHGRPPRGLRTTTGPPRTAPARPTDHHGTIHGRPLRGLRATTGPTTVGPRATFGSHGTNHPSLSGATVRETHREPAWDQAQGSIGQLGGGNAGKPQRTSQRSKTLRSSEGRKDPGPNVATRADSRPESQSNGERESERGDALRPAAEGKASKGVAPPGKASPRPEPSGEEQGQTGNVANPMAGCRVQQTCRVSSGVNRRSREERQGRNASGVWQLRAEGRASAHPGVDARHLYWRRGDL
jgi:hypothetical protein